MRHDSLGWKSVKVPELHPIKNQKWGQKNPLTTTSAEIRDNEGMPAILASTKVGAKVSEDLKLTETGMLDTRTASLRLFVRRSATWRASRAGISGVHKKALSRAGTGG